MDHILYPHVIILQSPVISSISETPLKTTGVNMKSMEKNEKYEGNRNHPVEVIPQRKYQQSGSCHPILQE